MSISIEFLELSKTVTKIEFEILVQDDSEIKNVHLYLDGKIIKSWEKRGKLVYRTDKPLSESEHMYSVTAEDISGNVGSTSIKQFYVEKHEVQTGSIYGKIMYYSDLLKYVKILIDSNLDNQELIDDIFSNHNMSKGINILRSGCGW